MVLNAMINIWFVDINGSFLLKLQSYKKNK